MNPDLDRAFLENVAIVLVRTTHPGNIGAVARACKNMGCSDLRLVAPDIFPSEVATRRASGAEDLLERAGVFDSLDSALSDCHIVFGASARSRKMVWPGMNPRDCAQFASEQYQEASRSSAPVKKVALLFGQESSGLTNEELHRCNYHVTIPANPDYSSLNLAMAVQVICYEFRMAWLELIDTEAAPASLTTLKVPAIRHAGDEAWDNEPATAAEVEGMLGHLEETATMIGYHNPENPRVLMERFRRLFQRTHLDRMEVNILRGMFKAMQKHLP